MVIRGTVLLLVLYLMAGLVQAPQGTMQKRNIVNAITYNCNALSRSRLLTILENLKCDLLGLQGTR